MQNNATELTQKLLKSLDDNYNVIDMPTVIHIISLLEKVAITKELLETTRLGKHVNELRRRTQDDSLSRRAKELVKKWRNMVLPDAQGGPPSSHHTNGGAPKSSLGGQPPPFSAAEDSSSPFKQQGVGGGKKRSAREAGGGDLGAGGFLGAGGKRHRMNGMSEFDFSDNSNSSFNIDGLQHHHQHQTTPLKQSTNSSSNLIIVNSDSNSSMPEKSDPLIDQQMPKKRGRKKGSKNHKNLLDEAETSFTNKMAVSRGMSKVKTTKELIAGLQNKGGTPGGTSGKSGSREDLNEKAAKLTERVSIIDQKLNTNSHRYKSSPNNSSTTTSSSTFNNNQSSTNTSLLNSSSNYKNSSTQRLNSSTLNTSRVIESGSVINDKSLLNNNSDEEVIVVDDFGDNASDNDRLKNSDILHSDNINITNSDSTVDSNTIKSLSIEECKALLPPVDKSVLLEEFSQDICTCFLKENKPDFSLDEDEKVNTEHTFEFVENQDCPAKDFLSEKYRKKTIDDARIRELHEVPIPEVNGNVGIGVAKLPAQTNEQGLYDDVRPDVHREFLSKNPDLQNDSDSVNRTESDTKNIECFREFFEVLDCPSYEGQPLRILPYVIID